MSSLSEISYEQAKKLMEETSFENRIIGIAMSGAGGNKKVSIYSINGLANFLVVDDYSALLQKGKSKLSYINFDDVAKWIKDNFEDEELSLAIKKINNSSENYLTKVEEVGSILKERLQQCDETLAKV